MSEYVECGRCGDIAAEPCEKQVTGLRPHCGPCTLVLRNEAKDLYASLIRGPHGGPIESLLEQVVGKTVAIKIATGQDPEVVWLGPDGKEIPGVDRQLRRSHELSRDQFDAYLYGVPSHLEDEAQYRRTAMEVDRMVRNGRCIDCSGFTDGGNMRCHSCYSRRVSGRRRCMYCGDRYASIGRALCHVCECNENWRRL